MALTSWRRAFIFVLAFFAKIVVPSDEIEKVDGVSDATDQRRPIWNIAHMVNDIKEVDDYIDRGANSIEFDITFDSEGVAYLVSHGIPCDCFRMCNHEEDFVKYLNYLREITTPGDPRFRDELIHLFLDLKVNKLSQTALHRGGQDIATKLLTHYWNGTDSLARAYLLVSMPSFKQMAFIRGFKSIIEDNKATEYYSKLAFDFTENEDIKQIEAAIKAEGLDDHFWIGDGITNCFPRSTGRLKELLAVRDRPEKSFLNKVYWWTVDRMSTMKKTLSMGVDGLITNYPERLIKVLNDEEISSRVRLATIDDNPWENYPVLTAKMLGANENDPNATEVIFNIQSPKIDYL